MQNAIFMYYLDSQQCGLARWFILKSLNFIGIKFFEISKEKPFKVYLLAIYSDKLNDTVDHERSL